MKQVRKLTAAAIFLFFAGQGIKAQTTLAAGDIAFTGYTSANTNDAFSFVLLKSVTAGTVINFTDNAWLNTGVFRTGEQTVTFTFSNATVAGREITISGPGAGTATAVFSGNSISAGSCTGTMPSLSTSGDQVLAYQGTAASPTFISGIHMNVYSVSNFDPVNTDAATWDNTNSNNTSASALPPGLTTGTTAVWIGQFDVSASEFDNARFNCTGSLSTAAQVRTSVNIYSPGSNWATTNGVTTNTPPSGCTFLGIIPLPVTITSFNGKLNADKTATLRWEVAEQLNIQQYVIEESNDGTVFKTLGTVAASNSSMDAYSFTDISLAPGNNYYRLKIVEVSGKVMYTNIINIKTAASGSFEVDKLQNPFTGTLRFELNSNTGGIVNIRISDLNGRLLFRESRNINAGINQVSLTETQKLPDGMLIMEISDAQNQKAIFRVIKSSN